MSNVTDFSRIRVAVFHRAAKQKRTTYLEGDLNWVDGDGIPIKGQYEYDEKAMALSVSYLDRHSGEWKGCLIKLHTFPNNYNHPIYRFICPNPNCKRQMMTLYFVSAPNWTCRLCSRLWWNGKIRMKDLEKARKVMKVGSPEKKLRALERILRAREALNRMKR